MFKVWKTFTSNTDVKGVLIAFLKPLLLITFNCSNRNAEIFCTREIMLKIVLPVQLKLYRFSLTGYMSRKLINWTRKFMLKIVLSVQLQLNRFNIFGYLSQNFIFDYNHTSEG